MKLNSKHEILNSKQYQNSNVRIFKTFCISNFGHLNLFRISRLEFRNCYRGFTLIELLIYMGIFSIVLFVTLDFFFLSQVLKGEIVQQQEVDRNARAALLEMTQTIRSATDVTTPLLGATGSAVSLNSNSISYAVNGGILQKSESGETHDLTSDSVTIENVSFTTRGEVNEKPTVSIAFTIRTNTRIYGKPDYITKTIQTTVQLR